MRFTLALMLSLVSLQAFAGDKLACELDMHPTVRGIFLSARVGLRERNLTPADVEFMFADPSQIRNPYLERERDINDHSFLEKMNQQLRRLKPELIAAARQALQQLLQAHSQSEAALSTAREETRMIFALKELPLEKIEFGYQAHPSIFWQKSSDGKPRLLVYRPNLLELKTFDLHHQSATETRQILERVGRFPVNKMELGHLVIVQDNDSSKSLTLHDLRANKTGQPNPLPKDVVNIHLVRYNDGNLYALARAPSALYTFRVNSDLQLVPLETHRFRSNGFYVVNSGDGRLVVVTTLAMTATVLDPLSTEKPRTFQFGAEIAGVVATFAPDGNYVAALELRDENRKVHFEFISSKYTGAYPTKSSYSANCGGAPITLTDGQVLFPIGEQTYDYHGGMNLSFYDPLHPELEQPTGLWARLWGSTPTLKPKIQLQGVFNSRPVPFTARNGRVYLAAIANPPPEHVQKVLVYDLLNQNEPIFSFPVGDPSVESVEIFRSKKWNQQLFIANRETSSLFFAGETDPGLIHEGAANNFTPPFEDEDGHLYSVTMMVDPFDFDSYILKLFRLTNINRENP